MPHLIDRLRPGVPGQLQPAEVLLHLGVQEVLIDGREFRAELLVQEFQDPLVAAHSPSLVNGPSPWWAMTHGSNPGQATRRAASGQPTRPSISPSRRSWQVPQPVPA